LSDTAQLILSIDGAGSETWRVTSAEVREQLFAPTEITVHAALEAPIEPDELIGLDASLEATFRVDDDRRAFHGVVVDVAETAVRPGLFLVEVVVASRIATLMLGADHRIYQEMTVQDVVSDVLDRAGIADVCEWSVNASYEPHENIVQYGESDYDFVTRLLFEEGIGFFVEQDAAAERILFFDDDTAHVAVEGDSVLRFVEGRTESALGLTSLRVTRRAATDQVAQRDYDLKNPGTDLTTSASAPETTSRELYDHPAAYVDPGRGQRLTDRVLERLQMSTDTVRGEGTSHFLASGRFFTADGLAREAANREYLVLEASHRFRSEGDVVHAPLRYDHVFEAIPLEVPYRPQAAAPPPVIAGVQHALATVPGGEEIHSDELGRTKVRFLWDRSGITDDKSSTWLRVGQLALGGSMVMPRIDFEVLVDFELGDLDRPAVSGHLYNAELPPPYELPGGCTVSSMQTATTGGGPGANELRFEDAAGSEEIFVNASKDMVASVDDNTTWDVGNNETCDVGSNNTLSVKANHRSNVNGNRALDVGGNQDKNVGGDYGDGTGVDLSVSIGGSRFVTVGGDHSETANATLSRTVGSLQCITGIAGYQRTVVGDSTTDVGAAWAELCGDSRGLKVVGSYTETVGALKFIKAKNVSIACDAAYTMNAAAEVIKAGGGGSYDAKAAIAMTAGAAFKVKAKNITFEAKSKLVFRGGGGVIELTKAGMVTIKAPSITVKNAKALNQIMHKSN